MANSVNSEDILTLLEPELSSKSIFCKFYHSKIEKETHSSSQFSLVTGFFREREKIFYTYSGPKTLDLDPVNWVPSFS